MKNFELIDRDEALKATSGSIVCNNHIKELPTIITAQQIRFLFNRGKEPRGVIYSGDGYADGCMVYDLANCPACDFEYEEGDKDWGEPFCPHCGQALKWDNEEEGSTEGEET